MLVLHGSDQVVNLLIGGEGVVESLLLQRQLVGQLVVLLNSHVYHLVNASQGIILL